MPPPPLRFQRRAATVSSSRPATRPPPTPERRLHSSVSESVLTDESPVRRRRGTRSVCGPTPAGTPAVAAAAAASWAGWVRLGPAARVAGRSGRPHLCRAEVEAEPAAPESAESDEGRAADRAALERSPPCETARTNRPARRQLGQDAAAADSDCW